MCCQPSHADVLNLCTVLRKKEGESSKGQIMKNNLPATADYTSLVIKDIPLIDVRAPVEYIAGSFPNSVNLPILDDEDRHLVGICYKQYGREAAFSLAYKRVSGKVKEGRVASWADYHRSNPTAKIFCFRGGMRSKTSQQWLLEEAGIEVERLKGGYKAYRRFLIEALQPENIPGKPVILGGRTGSGKTPLLKKLANSIDLEGAANHRGSAFGSRLTPQPSQIDFENRLAYQLIKHQSQGFSYIVLEDEGSYIGARYIPHELAAYFKQDHMVLLVRELDQRIEAIHQEYVIDAQNEYSRLFDSADALDLWHDDIMAKLQRIRKRLGGLRLKRVTELLNKGLREQQGQGATNCHRQWLELLICEYYDPMYDYQIEKSGRKVVYQGDFHEVLQYLGALEDKPG